MPTPLVGKQHKKALEDLHARYSKLREGEQRDDPSVVILEGVSGVGKSRVIRELYSKIRAEQSDAYWPPLPVEPDDTYSPLSVRKQIGPSVEGFVWESGALPTFGWWEFNGAKLSTGVAMSMDAQVEDVVKAHTTPVALARLQKAGVLDRFKGAPLKAVKDLRDMGQDQLVDRLLGLASETADGLIPVPGLKLALKWLKGGYDSARQARRDHDALARNVAQDEEVANTRSGRAALLADSILGLASTDVPGIVVVEDIHLMGESFTAFLDQITGKDAAPVLVIGTAWPDAESAGHSMAITEPYRDWRDRAVKEVAAEVIYLEAPTQADRIEIVRKWAPDISPESAANLSEKIHNPLALELVLTSKATRGALTKHHGDLPASYVVKVPVKLSEIYYERLGELDDQVRNALSAMAGSIPNNHQERTWPFIRHHIAAAIEKRGNDLLNEQGFGSSLAETIRGLAVDSDSQTWLVSSGLADTFREALMAEVAARHLENDLGLLDEMREEVVFYLGSWLADQSDDRFLLPRTEEARIVGHWYLSLAGDAHISEEESARALVSSAYLVAEEQASINAYGKAARIMQAALGQVPDHLGGRSTGVVESEYLDWVKSSKADETTGLKAALEVADALFRRGEAGLRSTDPSHVDWLFEIGLLNKQLGHEVEAISVLERAFEKLPHVEGNVQLEPTEIAQHQVELYESVGRVEDAIRVWSYLVNDARSKPSRNTSYLRVLTEDFAAFLDRHDRGVPADYLSESDSAVEAREAAVQSQVAAVWADVRNLIEKDSMAEAADRLSALYSELDAQSQWVEAEKLDYSCRYLAQRMLRVGQSSKAERVVSMWRDMRPALAAGSDWIFAKALTQSGKKQEAIEAHQRGLDHWLRQPGATVADRLVFEHRFGLSNLDGGLRATQALAEDLVEALAKASVVPEPDDSPNSRANWLGEQHQLRRLGPRRWAQDWVKLRGNFILKVTHILRADEGLLSRDVLERLRIWEQIGEAATDEDPEALRSLHYDLVQDAQYGADCVESAAAELLSRRLDRLLELRGGREDNS
ncbi:hypothetical protein LTI14_02135 [Nesterenkonia sp. YGD6]|uniref:hypothetical protein n=1 Tax=Nesterenkonia sp. YGD6 TaxID=2901231 RepID=UPI001F4CF94C|nr:hypothetical protein [Nesterenkonia sp. YGD6]MCH8562024.1 hypothetical protein [Nesterenkonia sp. YGD6]